MRPRNPWLTRCLLASTLALLLLVAASAPAWAATGLNPIVPRGASVNGRDIYDLYVLISPFAILVFVLVEVLLITIIIRYRRSRLPAGYRPPQWHGNLRLEITWTIIPFLILCVIGGSSFYTLQRDFVEPAAANDNMTISVSGHQFGWVFKYQQGFSVRSDGINATPMVIPTNKVVRLELNSVDVIHGFWVPDLTGKTDLVPGYTNYTWLKVAQTGEWRGQCTELCGSGHYSMQLRVKAVSQSDFETWAAQQQAASQQATQQASPARTAPPGGGSSPASSPSPSP
jgi:cytochrome c oxidase subunit 2